MTKIVRAALGAILMFYGLAFAQTAPIIPNITSPLAVVLIDPANGKPYKVGSADVNRSVVSIANINSPHGSTLINPITGVPYH